MGFSSLCLSLFTHYLVTNRALAHCSHFGEFVFSHTLTRQYFHNVSHQPLPYFTFLSHNWCVHTHESNWSIALVRSCWPPLAKPSLLVHQEKHGQFLLSLMCTREEVVARLHTEKIGIGNFVNEIRSHSVFTAKSLSRENLH